MIRKLLRTRRRKVMVAAVVLVLITASAAAAAWILLSGAEGQGGAKVGTYQISPAVSLTPIYNGTTVIPGVPGRVKADLVNAANVSEQVTELHVNGGGFTSDNPACDVAGFTFQFGGTISLNANETRFATDIGAITAPANLDTDCANSSITLGLVGATTP